MRGHKLIYPKRVHRSNFKLLTEHQVKIAFMICNEKSVSQICAKLGISEKTYFNLRSVVIKKLAVKTTIGLVKYIYRFGYLEF